MRGSDQDNSGQISVQIAQAHPEDLSCIGVVLYFVRQREGFPQALLTELYVSFGLRMVRQHEEPHDLFLSFFHTCGAREEENRWLV